MNALFGTMSRVVSNPWRFVMGNLRVKIMLLVLMPLLLSSIGLLALVVNEQRQIMGAQIEEERALLIESRKRAIRNNVELVVSMIHRIAEEVPDAREAQRQALDLIRNMSFENDNYVFVFRYDGLMLAQAAKSEAEGTNMMDVTDLNGQPIIKDMAEIARDGGGYYRYSWSHPSSGEVATKYSYAEDFEEWGWVIGAGVYVTDIDSTLARIEAEVQQRLADTFGFLLKIGVLVILLIGTLSIVFTRRIVSPIRHTARSIQDVAREVAAGRGNLTQRLDVKGYDEIGVLGEQFNAFLARMQDTLLDVQRGAREVHFAAEDIAHSSQELATRTDQAAANLQQTSSAMEEITSTVEHNAEHTQQADRLVNSTAEVAQKGQAAMGEVEKTMQDINASAAQIGDIVSMIDSIAFQTNILALNASVEAARAGEHGRGFAVVAQEVRKLAQDSANAAQEIKGLIEASTEHTRHGAEIVQRAGETMRGIFDSVGQVTAVIAEITSGSAQQSAGVGEVNEAVSQLDAMTQHNALMVQQSAGTAARMRQQAELLNHLIGSFRLGEEMSVVPPGLPQTETSAASRAAPAHPAERPQPVVSMESEWEEF